MHSAEPPRRRSPKRPIFIRIETCQLPSSARLAGMNKRLLHTLATSFCLVGLGAVLLPPSLCAQDWAKQMLDKSPRHQEWVNIKYDNRTVQAFIVYPLSLIHI